MPRRVFIFFGCLLSMAAARAQNPGNIGTGSLMFWLRGDLGITTGATFKWADNSGTNRYGSQSTSANQPVVTSTAADYMNYNPGIKLNGSQWLIMNGGFNTAGSAANEIYLVYQKATGSSDGFVLGTDVPGMRSYFYGSGVVQYGNSNKPTVIAPGYATNGANIFIGKYFSATDAYQAANGATLSALAPQVAPTTFTTPVAIGIQPTNSGGYNAFGYTGNIMELVGYNSEVDLTGTQRQQVESYLALKYGITLDSVGTGGKYYNSAGSVVYQGGGGNGYFTNIIGVARDDNTALYQKQSHLANDSVRLYLGSTPLTTALNGSNIYTLGADKSYIVMGDNSGKLCGGGPNVTAKPLAVDQRLDREWKITYTRTADAFNMDVTLASCAPFSSGTGNPSYLELLYSTAGPDLTTGSVMMNNTNGMSMTLSAGGVVTIAGLENALAAIAPASAGGTTVYFTVASNQYYVLPLTLSAFTAVASGRNAVLNWTMAGSAGSTGGAGFFRVERSADGINWDSIGRVDLSAFADDYSFSDDAPLGGINYYRLGIVDAAGNGTWSPVRQVVFEMAGGAVVRVFPNPAAGQVFVAVSGMYLDASVLKLYSVAGEQLPLSVTSGVAQATIDLSGLAAGVYFLRVKTPAGWQVVLLLRH